MNPTFTDLENARPVVKIQPANVKLECCGLICIAFGMLFIIGLFFALPIAEIVMAEKYRADMSCPNDIISPYTWMLTEGIVGIFVYGLCGIIFSVAIDGTDNSKALAVLFSVPLWFLSMFQCAWIIVGAIMFWRDCIDLETKSMNDFYWTVLIINLVSLYISGNTANTKK